MRKLLLLIALAICACDREPRGSTAAPSAPMPEKVSAKPAAQSRAPLVVSMPKDQGEVDRMILAGYTPHGTHLHPPGMKKCPLEQGGNAAVM